MHYHSSATLYHSLVTECSCGLAICSSKCEEHFRYNPLALQYIKINNLLEVKFMKIHTK